MKTRFRIERRSFGRSKIVLQVGDEVTDLAPWMPMGTTRFVWRDATEEDFLNRSLGNRGPARASAEILRGRFETPEPCPGNAQETTETEK